MDANEASDLQTSYLSFCNFVKKGSKTATDKTIKKICTDSGIYTKGLDHNRVDIEFRAHIGNAKRDVDFNGFLDFIDGRLAKVYSTTKGITQAEAVKEIRRKISEASPTTHGTTRASSDAITARLTDVKSFTGAHKERFDPKTGRGKGRSGREDPSPSFTRQGISSPRR